MPISAHIVRRGEHTIGRRGKKKHANIAMNGFFVSIVKQLLGKLARFIFPMEHVAETLELVEDDEVRLERLDADGS